MATKTLSIGLPGWTFADLFNPARLSDLHELFLQQLALADPDAAKALREYREDPDAAPSSKVSDVTIAVAPHVGAFVANLFGVSDVVGALSAHIVGDDPLFVFHRDFVKKRVLHAQAGNGWASRGHDASLAGHVARVSWHASGLWEQADEEKSVARATLWLAEVLEVARKVAKAGGASWTDELRRRVHALERALLDDESTRAATGQLLDPEAASGSGDADERDAALIEFVCDAVEHVLASRRADPRDAARRWVSLRAVHKLNYAELVPLRRHRDDLPEACIGHDEHRRERVEPFALTDARGSQREVSAEVEYCLYCHDRDKDSCSKGLRDKQGGIKKNPLGVTVAGCPLYEKISEMHLLRKRGEVIGSLATAMVDNPMLAGTGHRICNDCMKACVYQTQEPVNIPQIETRVLRDVLELPWGFEMYSLLTRWNPLNVKRPYALPYNGKNIAVVGLGPAGYTLSQHLLNWGFGVVGFEGLKLEPLDARWVGSEQSPPEPVESIRELEEPLESRVLYGFGGVSEYGITVRWDKNFLLMMYINLARRATFRAYGGVRFGGTFTLDDAWAMGFDHVAIAAGAGKPTLVPMKNSMIRGIRMASDFLMALQLTGAYKRKSLSNLQVRLPAVVIGGGLTAIDTATELLAYYVVQVEKTLERYEVLCHEHGEQAVRKSLDAEEAAILDEFLEHGRAIRDERQRAARQGEPPRIQPLLQSWGGVSLVYRRSLTDSPAYRLNHEEVAKSLEEGVQYIERLSPVEAHPDAYGAVEALTFERQEVVEGKLRGTGEMVRLPARTVCIAAGTSPNVTYENEYRGTFGLDARGYFRNHRVVRSAGGLELQPTEDGSGFFTAYQHEGRFVSYYGDNHPKYAGSVVKAMASAKDGHPFVVELFQAHIESLAPEEQPARDARWRQFARQTDDEFKAVVHSVQRLAPSIVEVVVRAPRAARRFEPGQFYRLQNFERLVPKVDGTPLMMEGLAMTGAWTDPERGLLSMIALEMGPSSRMCSMLEPGDPVVVMGPTGTPTEIAPGGAVLLAGGGLGNAVLFSIARAFKAHGASVLYFAGYRDSGSVFKRDEIEASTDQVVWTSDAGEPIATRRPQDSYFRGNIVQAMLAYARGELGEVRIPLSDVGRVIAIGSDRMMAAVKEARHGLLAPYLRKEHVAIGSINSPMQCMMKEICAQCLQRHVDPVTGEETMVYSCFNQDQPLDLVDFPHLAARLRQNSLQEKLANAWFDHLHARRAAQRSHVHLPQV
jgi:NADPH-dependent glutamate synthase beta subunit-like oxidoreductase/NAD(P)H-flavin reductase